MFQRFFDMYGVMGYSGAYHRDFDHDRNDAGTQITEDTIEDTIEDTTEDAVQDQVDYENGSYNKKSKSLKFDLSALMSNINSIEDKICQICLILSEAVYDNDVKADMEILVQVYGIGGIIFTSGSILRQMYVSDQYQASSFQPLLIGTTLDYCIELVFEEAIDKIHSHQNNWISLGVELGNFCLNNNIHILLDLNFHLVEYLKSIVNKDKFIFGIRHGMYRKDIISALDVFCTYRGDDIQSVTNNISIDQMRQASMRDYVGINSHSNQQEMSIRDIKVLNITSIQDECLGDILIKAFRHGCESIIVTSKADIDRLLDVMVPLVKLGRISALQLDKLVHKFLKFKIKKCRVQASVS